MMTHVTTDIERRVDIADQRIPQQKSVLHRLGGWFKRRFRAKKRKQVVEGNVEQKRNEQNVESRKVIESGPLWQNTSAEVWGRESCADSDGEADTTEPIHSDITSSMKSTTRLAGEGVLGVEVGKVLGSDGIYPNKVIVRTEQVVEASERTTALLTHRSLTKGNKLAELNGIESSAPVMAGCVDTLHVDSRGSGRWVSARRSDRMAVPVRAERDQSTGGRRSSQDSRRNSKKSKKEKSTPNGGNEGKGSRSDINCLDVESASVVRVEVSDDDIRAIAEDSIVPTDGQKIEDSKTRERKLKALLKGKGFVKVKSDGDRRYVMKTIGQTSFCSVVRRLFCLEAEEQNQVRDAPNLRLEAQVGREDLNNREVNKSIRDQNVGRKRRIIPVLSDPPLRNVKSPEIESNRLRPKMVWTPMQVKKYEALKESFERMVFENKRTRMAKIDVPILESEPKQKEQVNFEEEWQNLDPEGLDLILESDLAQIRQIDQTLIESITKRSDPTDQSEEWHTEILDIVSESECSPIRHIDRSVLKPEQPKEPAHEKEKETSAPEALEMVLESELAQTRQIDQSEFESVTKRSGATHQVDESESLVSDTLDIFLESETSPIRCIDGSVFEPGPEQKEAAYHRKRKTLAPEEVEMMLESELARMRGIGESVFGTQPKPYNRERTKDGQLSISEAVKTNLPLLKEKGITLHNCLGRGGEAFVFRGDYRTNTESQELAVKVCLSKKHDLRKELKHMKRVQHKNVIRFYDIWHRKHRIPFLCFELAEGDLRSAYSAIKEKTNLLPSLEDMRVWSKGLVSGLHFVHQSGLMHNDLKMTNILMVRDPLIPQNNGVSPNTLVPKIADFGHSKVCLKEDGNLIRGQSNYGTPYFAPPECLLYQEVEDMRFMDVWSLGIIIYWLVTDHKAFRQFPNTDMDDPLKVTARVDHLFTHKPAKRMPWLSHISEEDQQEIKDFLSRFFVPKISERESIDSIAQDLWFEDRERSPQFYKERII